MSEETPPVSLDEIRRLPKELPAIDEEAAQGARRRQESLAKPPGSLGRLEELAGWLSGWQGRHPPSMDRPRIAVFAARHGIARHGVSYYPAEACEAMVQNLVDGGGAINQICALVDADLRVYEMALEEPTEDISEGPAMSETECARAIAFGMMTVEQGFDIMALGAMGVGNSASAAAICMALYGGDAASWIGPEPGLDEDLLKRKRRLVADAVAANEEAKGDPLNVLCCLGGPDAAAILGALMAARLARTPVLLDGFVASAAGAIAQALDPGMLDHCQIANLADAHGHAALCERLGKRPLLDLDIALGEATGAALAIPLLKAAVACQETMATAEAAGLAQAGPDA